MNTSGAYVPLSRVLTDTTLRLLIFACAALASARYGIAAAGLLVTATLLGMFTLRPSPPYVTEEVSDGRVFDSPTH